MNWPLGPCATVGLALGVVGWLFILLYLAFGGRKTWRVYNGTEIGWSDLLYTKQAAKDRCRIYSGQFIQKEFGLLKGRRWYNPGHYQPLMGRGHR